MKSSIAALTLATMASTVAGHGYLSEPKARMPGDAMMKACGQTVYNMFKGDINGNPQGALQNPGTDYKEADCGIWMCKGMQFDDNKANIKALTAGQKLPMVANIAAPHTGVANVSIVDLSSGSVIGQPLIEWTNYASTETGVTDDMKNFEVTIPSDIGSQCATEGACVLKWWWDARKVDQTYMACVDITISGGSGGAAPAPSSSAAASSTAAASTTAAASSATPTPTKVADVTTTAVAAPSATASAGSDCAAPLPEKFTVQQLIAYLRG
jgi:predicted carbohydrate-binding protein with CBM5 and CBM33 domain